jgi:hypothetical protein
MRNAMTELNNLTVEQLRQAVSIKERIESLQAELIAIIADGTYGPAKAEVPQSPRRRMRAAGRARIAAAARTRWAKVKGHSGRNKQAAAPKRRTMSPAARAKIAAAARARWAKAKAAVKNAL